LCVHDGVRGLVASMVVARSPRMKLKVDREAVGSLTCEGSMESMAKGVPFNVTGDGQHPIGQQSLSSMRTRVQAKRSLRSMTVATG
jgi:hypothetical protein